MSDEKRIVEINGVKIEVDMRTAKRIDSFKVGDSVKVLRKKYSDEYEVLPGIIVDFANFKDLPTIVVAVCNEGSWSSDPTIEFININEQSYKTDKIDIVYVSKDEIKVTRDGVVEKFERAIDKKKNELADLENKFEYFKTHFLNVTDKEDK